MSTTAIVDEALQRGGKAPRRAELTLAVERAVAAGAPLFEALLAVGIGADDVVAAATKITGFPPAPQLLLKNPLALPPSLDAAVLHAVDGVPLGMVQGRLWVAFDDPSAATTAVLPDGAVVCLAVADSLAEARVQFHAAFPPDDDGPGTVTIAADAGAATGEQRRSTLVTRAAMAEAAAESDVEWEDATAVLPATPTAAASTSLSTVAATAAAAADAAEAPATLSMAKPRVASTDPPQPAVTALPTRAAATEPGFAPPARTVASARGTELEAARPRVSRASLADPDPSDEDLFSAEADPVVDDVDVDAAVAADAADDRGDAGDDDSDTGLIARDTAISVLPPVLRPVLRPGTGAVDVASAKRTALDAPPATAAAADVNDVDVNDVDVNDDDANDDGGGVLADDVDAADTHVLAYPSVAATQPSSPPRPAFDSERQRLARLAQLGRLRQFRFERQLGEGGMASVYLGQRVDGLDGVGALLAVKVLKPHLVRSPVAVARFRREVHTLLALRHDNIVGVVDADVDVDHAWLAMPYLDGGTLMELLAQTGPMPLAMALPIVAAVLEGLVYAHEHGVVHRDIKPQNVLLARHGAVGVADFGLALVAGAAPITGTGFRPGTAAYMAPEQAQGGVVDGRADLFSVGVVLVELLTGKHPFARATVEATLMASSIADLDGFVVGDSVVDDAIGRLVVAEPALRFGSAAEVLDHLAPLLAVLPSARDVVEFALRDPLGAVAAFAQHTRARTQAGLSLSAMAAEASGFGGTTSPQQLAFVRQETLPALSSPLPSPSTSPSTPAGGAQPALQPSSPAPLPAGSSASLARFSPAELQAVRAAPPLFALVAIATVVAIVVVGVAWGLGLFD